MVAPQSSLLEAAAAWFDAHLAPHSAIALSHAVAAARLTLRAQAEPALDRAERDYLGGLLKTDGCGRGRERVARKALAKLEGSITLEPLTSVNRHD